jgi:N-acetylmuramoyl-L-alanine amidase
LGKKFNIWSRALSDSHPQKMMRILAPVLALLLIPTIPADAKPRKTSSVSESKPVVESAAASPSQITVGKFNTIVIDAGHGGHDPGGIPQNLIPEKGVALDVALRLSKRLSNYGYKTVLTRSDDTFISLDQRVQITNSQSNALFISIHFNSAERPEARGTESYYCAPAVRPLATSIQERVASLSTGENRGTKTASYYVLRKAHIPAVLVECGFLTNKEDTALALTEDYRQNLAEQIAEAVVLYQEQEGNSTQEPAVLASTQSK